MQISPRDNAFIFGLDVGGTGRQQLFLVDIARGWADPSMVRVRALSPLSLSLSLSLSLFLCTLLRSTMYAISSAALRDIQREQTELRAEPLTPVQVIENVSNFQFAANGDVLFTIFDEKMRPARLLHLDHVTLKVRASFVLLSQ